MSYSRKKTDNERRNCLAGSYNIPYFQGGENRKDMTPMPHGKWDQTLDKRIEKLLEPIEQAIEKAKRLKGKVDGNYIDSRG